MLWFLFLSFFFPLFLCFFLSLSYLSGSCKFMLFYYLSIDGNISAVVRSLYRIGVDTNDGHSRSRCVITCGFLQLEIFQLWLFFFFDQTCGHFRFDTASLLDISWLGRSCWWFGIQRFKYVINLRYIRAIMTEPSIWSLYNTLILLHNIF